MTVVGAITALATACSSATARSGSTTRETTSLSTTVTTTPIRGDLGSGSIAGAPFAADAQFVQFDSLADAWRLHIVAGRHSCADDLASIRPAVGIDFLQPADSAATPPAIGTHHDLGVVFVPAVRASTNGPVTTTAGVSLAVVGAPLEPGTRWSGHLTVTTFAVDGKAFAFDGPIDAVVCPAATS